MLGFYLIPTLVAWSHEHHHLYAIVFLNVLSGWTLVGWIGALVWAFKREEPLPNKKKNHRRKKNHHRKSTTRTQPYPPSHTPIWSIGSPSGEAQGARLWNERAVGLLAKGPL